jgi:hypothetical protein
MNELVSRQRPETRCHAEREPRASLTPRPRRTASPELVHDAALFRYGGRPGRPGNPVSTREWQAYVNSPYGYCDANVLGKLWKVDIDAAKIRLGTKLLAHDEGVVDHLLGEAYSQHSCSQSFNFEDAPKIAELWGAAPAS